MYAVQVILPFYLIKEMVFFHFEKPSLSRLIILIDLLLVTIWIAYSLTRKLKEHFFSQQTGPFNENES